LQKSNALTRVYDHYEGEPTKQGEPRNTNKRKKRQKKWGQYAAIKKHLDDSKQTPRTIIVPHFSKPLKRSATVVAW